MYFITNDCLKWKNKLNSKVEGKLTFYKFLQSPFALLTFIIVVIEDEYLENLNLITCFVLRRKPNIRKRIKGKKKSHQH